MSTHASVAAPAEIGAGQGRFLDWNVAVGTAVRLIKPGPEVPREDADRAVASLREFSVSAEAHVRELTGLGTELPEREGDVVDRPTWVRGAARGLSELTDTALSAAESEPSGIPDLLGGLSARGAGAQAGVVLAYLGSKVLGQYDPFAPSDVDGKPGRLLLVAPNVVAAQRALDVPERDFQMWVCLHESTHRLQFSVPWLREYFATSLGTLLSAMDTTAGDMVTRLPAALRASRSGRAPGRDADAGESSPGMVGLIELLQTPEQRAAFDRIIALSTLLEGHADHVMDAVGPRVVPEVELIRERFTERRKGGGMLDRLLRSLLGLDAKMRQYAQGAAFTRHVVSAVGMAGFSAVWAQPENLPSRAELAAPEKWLRRVHG